MKQPVALGVRTAVGVIAFVAAMTTPADAQTQRAPPPGGGAQAAQSQLLYQQAAAERDSLRQENERLKKELEAAKVAAKQADAAKGNSAAAQRALAAAQETIKSQDDALAQTRDRLQELLTKFRETTGALAGVESERGQLRQALGAMTARFDQCALRNVDLRDLMDPILTRLEHPGVGSAVASREPFTRQYRTRMENLADDYRARAEELKVSRPQGEAAAPAAKPPR
jgi:chromosome segregation ATPase